MTVITTRLITITASSNRFTSIRNRSTEPAPAPAPLDFYAPYSLSEERKPLGARSATEADDVYCESASNECGRIFRPFLAREFTLKDSCSARAAGER
jgi:hypothetical protein